MMPTKRERDAEEDDATWRYRNLERKLVLKETIYGLTHIAIVPTLFELARANMKNHNVEKSIALLERALTIKDAHPSDASDPGTYKLMFELRIAKIYRKLVSEETIYGPSHIAVVPTLFDLAFTYMKSEENHGESYLSGATFLERALSIKDAHPTDSSEPDTRIILFYLRLCIYFPSIPDITKITYVVDRSLTLQEEKGIDPECVGSDHTSNVLLHLCLQSDEQRRVEFQERLLKILEAGITSSTELPSGTESTIQRVVRNLRANLGLV